MDAPQPNIRFARSTLSVVSNAPCLPGIDLCAMYWDKNLSGRKERRLPIMVVVRLAPVEEVCAEEHERTHTDNLSEHGLRVYSTRPWQLGAQAEITPVKEEPPIRGEVVYCQKVDNGRFFVGFKFSKGKMPWPIFERFDGI